MHARRPTVLMTLLGAALCIAPPALAQPPHAVGVVMGFPASVGVLWHVSEGIALRPDVAVNRQSSETTSALTVVIPGGTPATATSRSSGWTTSIGASALFYLGAPDALRVYLTPRFAYAWTRTESESEPASLTPLGPYESRSDGFLVAGSVGAQYRPHDRFTLFGELGLSYTRQDGFSGYSVTRSDTVTTSLGLRSGVGVVVYF